MWFLKVNSLRDVREHLTPHWFVDNVFCNCADEPSLVTLDPNGEFKLDEQDSIILYSSLKSLKAIIEIPTKAYVDSLSENGRNRQDKSKRFNHQYDEIDNNKLTNIDTITISRNPTTNDEV